MKIRVVGLKTCKLCKALREALERYNIDHVFSDCDSDPKNCDALESLTGTTLYPMVLVMDLEYNLLEIAYLATNYDQLTESVTTQNGIRLTANHSVDGLLRYTINRLYLNI